jgi:hypothetical protein
MILTAFVDVMAVLDERGTRRAARREARQNEQRQRESCDGDPPFHLLSIFAIPLLNEASAIQARPLCFGTPLLWSFLAAELKNREEDFVAADGSLIPGRPVKPVLNSLTPAPA